MPGTTNYNLSPIRAAEVTNGKALVAVDLGAESCRTSLLRWLGSGPQIRVVHRFSNSPVKEAGSLRWDIRKILRGVEEGLRRCADLAPEGIAAIGVDGWAVDYVRLDANGSPASDPFCYRDERNVEAQRRVHELISPSRLYHLTGIQILPINTLYQLFADGAGQMNQDAPWTNLPEFVLSCLGGRRVSEYTNATHTQLIDPADRGWCKEIFARTGLALSAAPPLVQPGTQLGELRGALALLPAFRETALIAPACHDTASAIAGIPAHGNDWAFISSGTWSLVGTILDAPCVSEAAREKNFSNEGGVGGKTNFLKNVNGMWLLQQCLEQWQREGHAWTLENLIGACAEQPAPTQLFDVDDPNLIAPGDMPARIVAQITRQGKPAVSTNAVEAPQMANLIFHSLVRRYTAILDDLGRISGKTMRRIYIVGGGSRNRYLNQLTARATGLEVLPGSTESTTMGNFAIQLASLSGDATTESGVTASSVAGWAEMLLPRRW